MAREYREWKPGLVGPASLADAVRELWEKGLPPGDKPGWPSVDRLYTVVPGQVTIITGWPSSGKSEWLDAVLVNLMHQGWLTAIYSPENQPLELHAAKFLEKLIRKPFGHGIHERMTEDEAINMLIEVMAKRFIFARMPEDGSLAPAKVIEVCEPWLLAGSSRPRALVMDPWNEMEHWRPHNMNESEYVSQQLQLVRSWARHHAIHVFIVAHPQKMRRDPTSGKLPVPTLDMISGSQHWWNKADAGICVNRDQSNPDSNEVEILVQKVRFKHVGRPGVAILHYDRVTGTYSEPRAKAWNDVKLGKEATT